MKNAKKCQQSRVVQRFVQAIEGGLIIFLTCLSIASTLDLSIFIYCIAINQIQYVFTGWCPITVFINKISNYSARL